MKRHSVRHDENLVRLARIEGQMRGIRRMMEEGAYCVDILTQIQAVQAALRAILRQILRKHLDHCVTDALRSGSRQKRMKKIDEVLTVIRRATAAG